MNSTTYRTIDTEQVISSIRRQLGDRMGPVTVLRGNGVKSTRHAIRIGINGDPIRVNGDLIQPNLYLWNSYDVGMAFVVMIGYFRFVCQNFCHVGESFYKERIIHRVGETCERKLKLLDVAVGGAVDYMLTDFADDMQEYTAIELTETQMIQVAGNLSLNDKAKRQLITRICFPYARIDADRGNNAWSLYQMANMSLAGSTRSNLRFIEKDKDLLTDVVELSRDVIQPALVAA